MRLTNPTEVRHPGIATEERQSRPMDEHDADIGRSPLTWLAESRMCGDRHIRSEERAGEPGRLKATPRPSPTPAKPALRAAGDHISVRRESS